MRSTPRPETITVSNVTGTVPTSGPHNQPYPSDPSGGWQQPQYYTNPHNPPPRPKRGMSNAAILGIIFGSLGVLVLLGVIGAVFGPPDKPVGNDGIGASGQSAAETTNANPSVATTAAPVTPVGPLTSFGDGIWQVGTLPSQIKPGTYKATVPDDSWGCYWERAKGTSGEFQDIIANGLGERGAPVIVTIVSSDKAFRSEDCGTWSAA